MIRAQALVRQHADDARWGAHARQLDAADGRMWCTPRGGGHDDKAHPPIHPTRCAPDALACRSAVLCYCIHVVWPVAQSLHWPNRNTVDLCYWLTIPSRNGRCHVNSANEQQHLQIARIYPARRLAGVRHQVGPAR